jgi:hypothetical protein
MTHHHRLADRDRIRIHAESKHEKIKAEAIDILIDALHRQMSSGGTISFDHNLAGKIEKLINRGMTRARIIALVKTGIPHADLSIARRFKNHRHPPTSTRRTHEARLQP